MLVKFTLAMEDVVLKGRLIDCLALTWQEDLEEWEILDVSHRWISTDNFLTQRMEGLTQVGESSLTIEPLDDLPDFYIPYERP